MKALIDNIGNNILVIDMEDMIFSDMATTNDIVVEILVRLDKLNLNEAHSCEVTFEENAIVIRGDEDLKVFELVPLHPIV